MPLFDLFFAMLYFFLFVMWIWLVIAVYGDIFRSDDLGGGAKALWVAFVLVLPYLGVLAYVVARGGRMQERQVERAAPRDPTVVDTVHQVSAPFSTADELLKLTQLRDQGVLSADEFGEQKIKLLA